MEQIYQSILLKPSVSKRYKHFIHHLISANASFKVAHELIPYFMEFEGIDFFFRNKIEESYFKAIAHMDNSLAALALVRNSYCGGEGHEYIEANLGMLQDSISEVKADTSLLVRTFYAQLGSSAQLNSISRIRAMFSEVVYRSIELSSEVG